MNEQFTSEQKTLFEADEATGTRYVVTELECPACNIHVWGDAVPASGRCPRCGTDDVETRGHVEKDEEGRTC